MEPEKELNAKILKITMTIKEEFPELLKYLDEMPVTIPREEHPAVTAKNLSAYYDSLMAILGKYLSTPQPVISLQRSRAICE